MANRKRKPEGPGSPAKAGRILDILEKTHSDARIMLNYENPFQLIIVTILAAQCTDEKVNEVAPNLFAEYPEPADVADAPVKDIEAVIRPLGTFRQKTRSIRECSRAIVEDYDGKVPDDVDQLTKIRGVGRKTANIVVAAAFGGQAIAVDTHVFRVTKRLGLADSRYPDKVERQLCAIIPRERWSRATLLFGAHGRRICTARKPDHEGCPVKKLCDFYRDLQSA
jgi:endonuclease-3